MLVSGTVVSFNEVMNRWLKGLQIFVLLALILAEAGCGLAFVPGRCAPRSRTDRLTPFGRRGDGDPRGQTLSYVVNGHSTACVRMADAFGAPLTRRVLATIRARHADRLRKKPRGFNRH